MIAQQLAAISGLRNMLHVDQGMVRHAAMMKTSIPLEPRHAVLGLMPHQL
jgi:hypothetical protein